MTIETDRDVTGLMNAGRVVGLALRAMQAAVRPGMTARDGWTAKTRDGKPVASFEHTVVITDDKPLLLTAV
jgi:methionine aminopeptidase